MGVRGLTTFIATYSDKYLQKYQLSNTYLVLDGNNIASHLYKWHAVKNDCFGGDYDKYAKTVYDFFNLLNQCNITPLIIFDGGYENKKIKTVYSRLDSKVKSLKGLNSVTQSNMTSFPLFLRDLFVEIVVKLKLKAVRCDFEADYEMACLARTLNCPVLSYDSDFYIFDVLYIPFSSFDMEVHSSSTQFYIKCSIFKIERFLKSYGGISKESLPLISILLGNDYIGKKVFENFYNQMKLAKPKQLKSEQQRRIVTVMKWIQNETYESALRKILGRLKSKKRKSLAKQIKTITEGYKCKNSKLMAYLDIKDAPVIEEVVTDVDPEKINHLLDAQEVNDNSTSDSEDLQDEDEDLSLFVGPQDQKVSNISPWFLEKFHKCEFPSAFMDIILRHKYFCVPQLEDYSNQCSHLISMDIISAVNKMLTGGGGKALKCVLRGQHAKLIHYDITPCKFDLPTITSVIDFNSDILKTKLLDVLELNSNNVLEFIQELPSQWQLYFISIMYWIKHAKPAITYSNVYALIMCMFLINHISPLIGYYRSTTKFLNKFEKRINSLSTTEPLKSEAYNTNNLEDLINKVTEDECLICYKELINYFQMEFKMTTYVKLFDIHIVDCFAQFQSCLMHIKYLNLLLNKPYENCIVSDFYDGTFLYNMSNNLLKRTNVDAYLNIILGKCPSILKCILCLTGKLSMLLSSEIVSTIVKKKRRKKKKTNINDARSRSSEEEFDDGDTLMDVNNRFSLLHLAE